MINGNIRGINITVANSTGAALESGDGVMIGSLFGYAVNDAAIAANVVLTTEGVLDAKVLGTDVIAVGDKLSWNNTTKQLQKATTTLDSVATAVEISLAGDVSCLVKLTAV